MVDALTAALAAGDADRLVAALRGRSEAERREAAPLVVPTERFVSPYAHFLQATGSTPSGRYDETRERLTYVAILGTATFTQMRAHGVPWVDEDAASAVLLDRRPPWLASWAQWVLSFEDVTYGLWPVVRDLVRAGVIERPPAYIPGLLAMRWHFEELGRRLDRDPEFFEQDVWDLIAYSGEDGSQRRAESGNKTPWVQEIVARVDDRERLLDLTLERLNADLSAYRAAWYTKLWKALKVTREERAARTDGLRALLGAAAEPVVAFAVSELAKPGGTVTGAELAPALSASAKATVRAALKRLDGEPALAAIALGHPDPEVQSEVLDRLERWGLDDAARDTLRQHLDLISATQRPRAEALLGVTALKTHSPPDVDLDAIPDAIRTALNFGGPLPPAPVPGEPVLGERVEPMASFDELIAALRTVESEVDERALDAILRRCDQAYTGPAFAPDQGELKWLPPLHRVVHAWRHRSVPPAPEYGLQPLPEAEERAAQGLAGPLLSLPTHAGGWIDPFALLERRHEHVGEHELADALLRLAPDGRAAALEAAREVPGRHGAIIRCALGGEPVKGDGPAVAAARAVAGLDRAENVLHRLLNPPEWQVLHLTARLTRDAFDPERPFAGYVEARPEQAQLPTGVTDFPSRRDLAAAHRFPAARYGYADAALVELLVRAGEPLAPLTLRYVVLALGAEDARAYLLAADVVTAAIEDGRIDALPTDDVADIKPNRLAARLTAVAEAGPLHRAVVRDFLDAAIPVVPARPGPLLVLFDELCAATHTGPRQSREHLATLKQKPARSLLERSGDPPPEEARFALAARARRAYRWMQS